MRVHCHCPAARQRQKQKRVTTLATDAGEPVFYNQVPLSLVQELMHMSSTVAIIDLTAGAGTWALAALEAGVPYVGVVLTQKHQEALMAHLQKEALPPLLPPPTSGQRLAAQLWLANTTASEPDHYPATGT